MASCEKCWGDSKWEAHARGLFHGDAENQLTIYDRMIKERDCTPEEQAGPYATECGVCKRQAVHQHVHICVACGSA